MKRHFLLQAPASCGNNSLSREADIVKRALIKPSPETIPQENGGSRRELAPGSGRGFLPPGEGKARTASIS